MKQCDFAYPGRRPFICILPMNHLSDHKDKEGFAMFNIDVYTVKKNRKVKEKKSE